MSTWYAYEQIVRDVQREQRHAAKTAQHVQEQIARRNGKARQLAGWLRAVWAARQARGVAA